MTQDPFAERRAGLRRVHVVTASVAAATVVGTGAAALALASADSASAQQTSVPTQQGTDGGRLVSGTVPGGADGSGDGTGVAPQRGVRPPAAPPGRGSGGSRHASSGGS